MSEHPSGPATDDIEQLRNELTRLRKINRALMARAEREMDGQGSDFALFRTSVVLENQVRERTRELESALAENQNITRALTRANRELELERETQLGLIRRLEETHHQLVQSEKLASIGQLAAGVAHEINNPIGFVSSNLGTLRTYTEDLLNLIELYEAATPANGAGDGIRAYRKRIDFDFLRQDILTLIAESREGVDRVKHIVDDLRDFARPGEEAWQLADLHAGLESALNMVLDEISSKAEVARDYGDIPATECLPSQLNQTFVNLLLNAAQAIRTRGVIGIRTQLDGSTVSIAIADDGTGIPPEILGRIFDPFFTTKPVGRGMGLGLSVAYGIVRKHGGHIEVESALERGSTFTVRLPVKQSDKAISIGTDC